MAVEQVHERVVGGVGVVLADRGQAGQERGWLDGAAAVGEALGVEGLRRQEAQHGVPEPVVHGRVEAVAADHPEQGAVLLPRLGDRERVRVDVLDDLPERLPVAVGEGGVAGHVEPPAAGAGLDPVLRDAVVGGQEVRLDLGLRLVEDGDAVEAEPALVARRVGDAGAAHARAAARGRVGEHEPLAVRRAGRFAGARRGVVVVAVEQRAVGRHVVEHAVEDHPDPPLGRVLDEVVEVLLGAEVGIDLRVVLGVVRVVRPGVEDRVEVDRRDAQRVEVGELLVDAPQVAAHVVAATRLLAGAAVVEARRALRVGHRVVAAVALGQRVPVELQDRIVVADVAGLRVVVGPAVPEPVREDLVDDRVLRPCGGGEALVVLRERPAQVLGVVGRAAEAAVERGRVVGVVVRVGAVGDDEPVPQVVRLGGEPGRHLGLPEVAAERERRLLAAHV